jgi:hypothetical protein
MPRVSLVLIFVLASLVGVVLTTIKIHIAGLHKRYRIFFAYLLFRIPYTMTGLLLDVKSDIYLYFWVFTIPVTWAFYVLVVRELCGLVLERYAGLKTLGRWFMYFATAVSLAVSVLSLLPRLSQATPQRSRILFYIYAIDRGVTLSLAIFLVMMVFLLSRYPVRLSKNVVVHVVVYTVFFLSSSMTMLLKSVFGLKLYTAVDTGFMALASACGFAWFWLLSATGEEASVTVPNMDIRHEQHLLSQLDSLNQTLLKAAKS